PSVYWLFVDKPSVPDWRSAVQDLLVSLIQRQQVNSPVLPQIDSLNRYQKIAVVRTPPGVEHGRNGGAALEEDYRARHVAHHQHIARWIQLELVGDVVELESRGRQIDRAVQHRPSGIGPFADDVAEILIHHGHASGAHSADEIHAGHRPASHLRDVRSERQAPFAVIPYLRPLDSLVLKMH